MRQPLMLAALSLSIGPTAAIAAGLPSDLLPNNAFLTARIGDPTKLDAAISACQYYKAIQAVQDCDASGAFISPINFDQWKHKVGIDFHPQNVKQYSAAFVNAVDLNLTRHHESIFYAPDKMAAYVCNYNGPASASQSDVNKAVDDALHNRNLIACVAMDYAVQAGLNSGQPFTRFFIFDPSGKLISSVDLDKEGAKFMPSVCTGCHGAYSPGPFATGGKPDIGGHFLPYDTGNFLFANNRFSLTELGQSNAIYHLNLNVERLIPLATPAQPAGGQTQATHDLIAGWYSRLGPLHHTLDKTYLPDYPADPGNSWANKSDVDKAFYRDVIARDCRTCHTAMTNQNFDKFTVLSKGSTFNDVCNDANKTRPMPNARATYDRFFVSKNTSDDQVAKLRAFLAEMPPAVLPPNDRCAP